MVVRKIIRGDQTSANNLTRYHYLKMTRYLPFIRGNNRVCMCINLGNWTRSNQARNGATCEHNLGFSISSFDST